jgi:hypothetical protein
LIYFGLWVKFKRVFNWWIQDVCFFMIWRSNLIFPIFARWSFQWIGIQIRYFSGLISDYDRFVLMIILLTTKGYLLFHCAIVGSGSTAGGINFVEHLTFNKTPGWSFKRLNSSRQCQWSMGIGGSY